MKKLDFNFIYSTLKQNYQKYDNPEEKRKSKEKDHENDKIERKLLNRLNLCGNNRDKYVQEVSNLDPKTIEKFTNKDFYDFDFVDNVLCLVDTAIYTAEKSVGLRNYFTNLQKIGSGSLGNAFESDFDDIKNSIIIKAPQDAKDNLTHEMLIGLYGTNKLRKEIPNFAFIYGGFDCSAPLIDKNKNILTWCNTDGPKVSYVIYEKVPEAMSMSKFMNQAGISEKDQIAVLLQIMLALLYASREIDFTHYDLNNENILIRKLPGVYRIRYPKPDGDGYYYVVSSYVAQIIDYGFSHIRVTSSGPENGAIIGYNYPEYYVYPEVSFPIADMYKILAFSSPHPLALILLRYFYQELPGKSIQSSISPQRDYYYFFPNVPETQNFTLLGLFEFAKANMPRINTVLLNENSRSEIPILDCASLCPSPEDFQGSGLPTSIPNFYNLITSLEAEDKKVKYINKFELRYTEVMNKFVLEIKNIYDGISVYIKEAEQFIQENDKFTYPLIYDIIKAMDFCKLLNKNIHIGRYITDNIYKHNEYLPYAEYLKYKRRQIETEVIPKLINFRKTIIGSPIYQDYEFKKDYDDGFVSVPNVDRRGNIPDHPYLFIDGSDIIVKWYEMFFTTDYNNMNQNPGEFLDTIKDFNPSKF